MALPANKEQQRTYSQIMNLAPIVLFAYKRLDTLTNTIESLSVNRLAGDSNIFIFSDAPRYDEDIPAVNAVRNYLKTIKGFKQVTIEELTENKGLADSIITGVSSVIHKYGKVIVLEDDLVTSVNFLSYMNQALDFYGEHKSVFSISGFTMPINLPDCSDVYFTQRASSWGWATWKDRWNLIDWNVADYRIFKKNGQLRSSFNKMGSDLAGMLDKQMEGKINSWAIRWCYHQFKNQLFSVYPSLSKIVNIGLENADATHTREKHSRFKTKLDESGKHTFQFKADINLNESVIRQFTHPYSIKERIKYKILNILSN